MVTYSNNVHERNAEDGEARPPLAEPLGVGGLVLSEVTHVQEGEVTGLEGVQAQLLSLGGRQSCNESLSVNLPHL